MAHRRPGPILRVRIYNRDTIYGAAPEVFGTVPVPLLYGDMGEIFFEVADTLKRPDKFVENTAGQQKNQCRNMILRFGIDLFSL